MPLSLLSICLLFSAGFLSGMVNAIAGGGTFLTFGALTLAGLPPIAANATSSIAQFPGYITSTLRLLERHQPMWRGALALAVISAVGALARRADPAVARQPVRSGAMVPWLLLAATALFAAGPWLKPAKLAERAEGAPARRVPAASCSSSRRSMAASSAPAWA